MKQLLRPASLLLCSMLLLACDRTPETPDYLQGLQPDFTLDSATGPLTLADFRGKVLLVYFGYTQCPDLCPDTLTRWRTAFNGLDAEEQRHVAGLLISVDPKRDSVRQLQRYTRHFHPSIRGATGKLPYLRKLAQAYRADFELGTPDADGHYTVSHSAFVYLIDSQGKVRALLKHDNPPELTRKQIRAWLP